MAVPNMKKSIRIDSMLLEKIELRLAFISTDRLKQILKTNLLMH